MAPALLWSAIAPMQAAWAEDLIVVGADRVSLRDSANLGVEKAGANFTLPSGFAAVSGDEDPDTALFSILARNAATGRCRVFRESGSAEGTVQLEATGPETACLSTAGDLEFFGSDAGETAAGGDDGWAFANGGSLLAFEPGQSAYETLPLQLADGAPVNLAALALQGSGAADRAKLLLRSGGGALADLGENANEDLLAQNPVPLSGATLDGAASLDISEVSGSLYLFTGRAVYVVQNNGSASVLSQGVLLPADTVAVFANLSDPQTGTGTGTGGGNGGGTDGDDDDDGSGSVKVGAFSPWSLLLFAVLVPLRRLLAVRRRTCPAATRR